MNIKESTFEFAGTTVFIEEIKFGNVMYVYIGNQMRNFDDLSIAMPSLDATHLLGEKTTDELSAFLADILKAPVLVSYSFPLDDQRDMERLDATKIELRKIHLGK